MVHARHARIGVVALAAGTLFAMSGGAPTATSSDPLATDLDKILADDAFDGADVGLVVRKADDGEVLYSTDSAQRRQPASTFKMLTASAALQTLGEKHRFSTTVNTDGKNLYLRGGGDPTILAKNYDALAKQVADSGVTKIDGKLVADATRYDDVPYATGWAWDDEPYSYNAETSALTIAPDSDYDAGSVIIRVAPGAEGERAKVEVQPPTSAVKVDNTAKTGAPDAENTVRVDREHGESGFTVSGTIPAGSEPEEEYMAVDDPATVAASVFRDALRKHGVKVKGKTTHGKTPEGARKVAGHRSMTVERLMTPFMKLSNNMHAETLVKESGVKAGDEGSWDDGIAALEKELPDLGVDPAELAFYDGSGLTRFDQISPDQFADLLVAVRDKPWFKTYRDSLPVAGAEDELVGGTLSERMRDTPAENNLRAKTGSLTGVNALSGYVTAANGEELVFSMLTNQYIADVDEIEAAEDAVGVRLAQYDGKQDESRTQFKPTTRDLTDREGLECSWVKAC